MDTRGSPYIGLEKIVFQTIRVGITVMMGALVRIYHTETASRIA